MSQHAAPFSAWFDLGGLSEAGAEVILSPTAAERTVISHWLGVEAINELKATIRLSRVGDDEYAYAANFSADIVQACVVTLEPVPSHVTGEFRRLFRVISRAMAGRKRKEAAPASSLELSNIEDDEPELIEAASVDLAAPVLEEVSLALDPYPRAPGVAFESPKEEKRLEDSPFAVLERLKTLDAKADAPGGSKKRR